jgi:predicted nucleic acid-binding Zn ribbon protein
LKGNGWYVTDYGGKKAPTSETKKDEAGKSDTAEAGKTETPSKTDTDD